MHHVPSFYSHAQSFQSSSSNMCHHVHSKRWYNSAFVFLIYSLLFILLGPNILLKIFLSKAPRLNASVFFIVQHSDNPYMTIGLIRIFISYLLYFRFLDFLREETFEISTTNYHIISANLTEAIFFIQNVRGLFTKFLQYT